MFANEKIPLMGNMYLRIGSSRSDFPTCRIQKGLLLSFGNTDLEEEGVGFGVPVLKFGREAIFPGTASIMKNTVQTFTVDYDLNLAERMAVKGRKINSRTFYRLKEALCTLHREFPGLRKAITHSFGKAGRTIGTVTLFEEVPSFGIVRVLYTIRYGNIHIRVDTSRVKKNCTIMLMNEQGANYFDRYNDTSALFLKGDAIGTWDETFADEASFVDTTHRIEFVLQKVNGARMFRGRELVPGKLAWTGIAYELTNRTDFSYNIRVGCK